MDFDNLGKRCFLCNQQDYLPIKCDLCNKFFCIKHSSIDSHHCPEFYSKKKVVKTKVKKKKEKKNKEKKNVIEKYLQKKDMYETNITIEHGKIIFSNDRLVPDNKNYHTYTDIPLNSEDEMSDLELNEGENNNKSNKKGVINTCGICYRCNIM